MTSERKNDKRKNDKRKNDKRKNGKRKNGKRPSLWEFILPRIYNAVREGVPYGEATTQRRVSDLLKDPEFIKRVKAASRHERRDVADRLNAVYRDNEKLPGPIPGAGRIFPETAKRFPGLTSRNPHARLVAATAAAIGSMITEASVGVLAEADAALKETAGAISPDATPPTQADMADWLSRSQCPQDTLREVGDRLANLWKMAAGQVRAVAWDYGCIVVEHEAKLYLAPAGHVAFASRERNTRNPLAPLVRAWLDRRPVS